MSKQDATSHAVGMPALSADDIAIHKYIKLSEQIKVLEREQSQLKEIFKHRGSFAGSLYAVSVSQTESMRVMSKEQLEEILGAERVQSLLKQEVRTYVKAFKLDGNS